MAMLLVEATDFYNKRCKEWKRNPTPDKTWDNWKFFFSHEFKEVRNSLLNARSSRFVSNVETAHQATAKIFAEMVQDQTKALSNLATATQADRQSFAALTETNVTLTKALGVANEKLIKANAEIACLKFNAPQQTAQRLDPLGYYWTHGYKVMVGHSSGTCTRKQIGHQFDATRADIKGVSEAGKLRCDTT